MTQPRSSVSYQWASPSSSPLPGVMWTPGAASWWNLGVRQCGRMGNILELTSCYTWLFSASQQSMWNIYIPDPLTLSLAMGLALAIEVLVNRHKQRLSCASMVWLRSLSSCHLPWKEPDLGTCSSKNIPRGIQNRLEPNLNPEANFSCPEAWSRVTLQTCRPKSKKNKCLYL